MVAIAGYAGPAAVQPPPPVCSPGVGVGVGESRGSGIWKGHSQDDVSLLCTYVASPGKP